MKKILAICAAASALVWSASAQGLVNFNNTSAAGTKISTNSVVGGPATGLATLGTGSDLYYYALFDSATATTVGSSSASVAGNSGTYAFSDNNWTFAAYATNGTTRAGQVLGNTLQALPNIAGGATGYLVVIGWSASIGSTISALQSYLANPTFTAFVGQSAVTGQLTFGNGAGISAPSPFGTAAPFSPGFTLGEVVGGTPIPEPGTMALAGLGIASLLALRRKK